MRLALQIAVVGRLQLTGHGWSHKVAWLRATARQRMGRGVGLEVVESASFAASPETAFLVNQTWDSPSR